MNDRDRPALELLGYSHIGPDYPAGKTYLVPKKWVYALQADYETYKDKTYGFYRSPKSGQVKAVIRHRDIGYEERYFATAAEARAWLRDRTYALLDQRSYEFK